MVLRKMAGKFKGQGSSQPGTPKGKRPLVDIPVGQQLGQMGLKSGPYASTSSKLTSQYMVRDHLNAHYKKLSTAKSAIDNKPPKTYMVSQKVRDQARREAIKHALKQQEMQKQRSQRRHSFSSADDNHEINSMMETLSMLDNESEFLDHYNPPQTMNTYGTSRTYTRPHSARARYTNGTVDFGDTQAINPSKTTNKTRVSMGGDLLETHNNRFNEAKPFQPRTLKSTRSSKLSQFKYYNAPPKKPVAQKQTSVVPQEATTVSHAAGRRESETKAPSLRGTIRPGTSQTDYSDMMMNETIMSRNLDDRNTPSEVPPLNISLDKDHMDWVASERAQKQHPSRHMNDMRQQPLTDTMNTGQRTGSAHLGATGRTSHTLVGSMKTAKQFHLPDATSRELYKEDEQLKYLNFIKEVTNDILDRGIFSNRVLMRVFENHVQNRRHELDERRMREMLDDLREDLGIPTDDSPPMRMSYRPTDSSPPRNGSRPAERVSRDHGAPRVVPDLHGPSAPLRSSTPLQKPPMPSRHSVETLGRSISLRESEDGIPTTVTRSEQSDVMQLQHMSSREDASMAPSDAVTGKHDDDGRSSEGNATADAYARQLQKTLYSEDEDGAGHTSADEYASDFETERGENEELTNREEKSDTVTQGGHPRTNDTLTEVSAITHSTRSNSDGKQNHARQRRRDEHNAASVEGSSAAVSELEDDDF